MMFLHSREFLRERAGKVKGGRKGGSLLQMNAW